MMNIRTSLKRRTAVVGVLVLVTIFAGCNDPSADPAAGGEAPDTGLSGETMREYLAVQESLAADTIDGVGDPARALAGHLADAGEANAAEAARLLGVTDDIEEARRQFETVSLAVVARLKAGGVEEGEVHVAHCPMAFDNSGASWVQVGTTVNNPYFGSQMQTCGAIRETFAAADGEGGDLAD